MHLRAVLLGSVTLLTLNATSGVAQQPACARTDTLNFVSPDLAGEIADLARLVELDGRGAISSMMIRRASSITTARVCADAESNLRALSLHATTAPVGRLSITPLRARMTINSAYASDRNNGALWAGRGLSSEFAGGIQMHYGVFSASLAPVLTFQQNRAYDIQPHNDPARNGFSYYWQPGIDYPQRFGPDAFETVDPGESYARADYAGFGFGVSTENLWWGPARRNPIIMSNTAPGLPHVFLESSHPVNVAIGSAEFMMFGGRLTESGYFDFDPSNDVHYTSGVAAVLAPRGLEGLFIGGSRVRHMRARPEDLSVGDLVLAPYRSNSKDPGGDDQLLSLFFRWASTGGGLEVYGEWGHNDRTGIRDFFTNAPDQSQGYTAGLQKVVRLGANRLRVSAEMTHLEDALPSLDTGLGQLTFYTHSVVTQGHTQRGQLLGASIGPGSEAQFIGADLFWRYGRTGLNLERVRFDDDTYHRVWSIFYGPNAHDVELSATLTQALPVGPLLLNGALGYSYRYNRTFLALDGLSRDYRRDRNITFDLSATMQSPLSLF